MSSAQISNRLNWRRLHLTLRPTLELKGVADTSRTMIRPWEARDFFMCWSRISIDRARFRIWSRAKCRLWASLSWMVLNFQGWFKKSFLWCLRQKLSDLGAVFEVSCAEDLLDIVREVQTRDWVFPFHVRCFNYCSSVDWCSNQWGR